MKIFVFVHSKTDDRETRVASKLDQEFTFFVDGVHGEDTDWLKRNFETVHHYFAYYDEGWKYCKVGDLSLFPNFVICFNDHEESVTDQDWYEIQTYFRNYLEENDTGDISPQLEDHLKTIRKSELTQTPILSSLEMVEKDPEKLLPTEYGFSFDIDSGKDICLAEVVKPNVMEPYTVVLRKFSEYGFRYLFSSLYSVNSWGASSNDDGFLKALWEHLGMKGECDLEVLLKEHTEHCYPGKGFVPMAEPEIYRLTIGETIKQLERKRKRFID